MLIILASWGINPIVLSDLKPDYVDLVTALEGTVVRLGRGLSNVNPLDPGPISDVYYRLGERQQRETREHCEGRRHNTLLGLCELVRGDRLRDYETSLLKNAISICDPYFSSPPVIEQVAHAIESRHPQLRELARDGGNTERFDDRAGDLLDALQTLGPRGPFGDVFSRQTSDPVLADRPTVFDMSSVDETDSTMQAALQLVCWSHGSAVTQANKVAADAGLRPERPSVLVMDELWKVLRASLLMVNRIDAITRLNRQLMLPQIMCTHTMSDLQLATPEASAMANGFVERSEMVFLGGLAPREMGSLETVFSLSECEKDMLTSWSSLRALSALDGEQGRPPGQGMFLLKVGAKPGIPFHVRLSPRELSLNDTNSRWTAFETSRQNERLSV